jgi:hypothetical protein
MPDPIDLDELERLLTEAAGYTDMAGEHRRALRACPALIAEVRRVRVALADGAPGETAEARARLLVADAADVEPEDLSCGDVVGVANLVAEVRALRLARERDSAIVAEVCTRANATP